MPKKFVTEIRQAFGDKYLKVFVHDTNQLESLQGVLKKLPSVRQVNITESKSKSSPERNLTVYKSKVYDIEETEEHVRLNLESFFESNPIDLVHLFTNEPISRISNVAFKQIISLFNRFGKNLENYQRVFSKFQFEEDFRDYFLPFLDSQSAAHSVTGETFNKQGQTDIIIKDPEGSNVFIAEFKIWRGESELQKAVDQLIERYVNWRDEHTALVVINKQNAGFSEVIRKAKEALENHSLYSGLMENDSDTSFLFDFHNSDDRQKLIKLQLLLFNYRSSER